MGVIKSKFKKMEEFDCSIDELSGQKDPRSPSLTTTRTPINVSSLLFPIVPWLNTVTYFRMFAPRAP